MSKRWSANCLHICLLTTSCILVQRLAFNCTVAKSKPQFGWLWIPFLDFFKFLFAPRLFECRSNDPPIAVTVESILHLAYLSKDSLLFQKLPTVSHSLVDCEFHFWTFSSFFSRLTCLSVKATNPPNCRHSWSILHLAYLSKDLLLFQKLPKVSHSLVDCEFHFWTFSSFFSRLACLNVEALIRQLPSHLFAYNILHTCPKTRF